MSQKTAILDMLKRGPVTPLDALSKLGCMVTDASGKNLKRDTNSLNLVGTICHNLTVIEKTSLRYNGSIMWRCKCICGRDDFLAKANLLKHGRIKSCGCKTKEIIRDARTTHGMTDTPTWKSWRSMIDRCYLPAHKSFKDYGGRGVTISDEWRDFETFLNDMGERPSGTTLDRIDGDLGYFKGNCRWSTAKEQANNRRSSHFLTIGGETKTGAQWADIAGIHLDTLYKRLQLGWSEFDAVFKPAKRQKNSRCISLREEGHPIVTHIEHQGDKDFARYELGCSK